MSKLMTFEYEGFTFEKYENGATVNVYDYEGNNIHAFTHYEIGSNQKKFEKSCIETYNELTEN